uniref:Uncharacterized protein n=1 Tax=Rhizophora mucronata TaxID=61149 RepID=A0A2P2QK94_RHIMU
MRYLLPFMFLKSHHYVLF